MKCGHKRQEKVSPFKLHSKKYGVIVYEKEYNECLDCHKKLSVNLKKGE